MKVSRRGGSGEVVHGSWENSAVLKPQGWICPVYVEALDVWELSWLTHLSTKPRVAIGVQVQGAWSTSKILVDDLIRHACIVNAPLLCFIDRVLCVPLPRHCPHRGPLLSYLSLPITQSGLCVRIISGTVKITQQVDLQPACLLSALGSQAAPASENKSVSRRKDI